MRRVNAEAPPRLATALLRICTPSRNRGALLGDLEEEHYELASRRAPQAARLWYWSQVLRSVWPLFGQRLAESPTARALGGVLAGSAAAIASATLFGGLLESLIGSGTEAGVPATAVVVTVCALVSSTCAGCASVWAVGGRNRWVLGVVGLVVVAPDLIHALLEIEAGFQPWTLLLVVLAIGAVRSGLLLGGRLSTLRSGVISGDIV